MTNLRTTTATRARPPFMPSPHPPNARWNQPFYIGERQAQDEPAKEPQR